jgi:CheY-like chemotaxis protein
LAFVLAIEPGVGQEEALARLADELAGHDLVVASSCDEALEQIERRVPDLILFPLLLPQASESALMSRLREVAGGQAVRTLTLPLLASAVTAEPEAKSPRWFYWFKPQPGADEESMDPCAPQVFAEQVRSYIECGKAELEAARAPARPEPVNAKPPIGLAATVQPVRDQVRRDERAGTAAAPAAAGRFEPVPAQMAAGTGPPAWDPPASEVSPGRTARRVEPEPPAAAAPDGPVSVSPGPHSVLRRPVEPPHVPSISIQATRAGSELAGSNGEVAPIADAAARNTSNIQTPTGEPSLPPVHEWVADRWPEPAAARVAPKRAPVDDGLEAAAPAVSERAARDRATRPGAAAGRRAVQQVGRSAVVLARLGASAAATGWRHLVAGSALLLAGSSRGLALGRRGGSTAIARARTHIWPRLAALPVVAWRVAGPPVRRWGPRAAAASVVVVVGVSVRPYVLSPSAATALFERYTSAARSAVTPAPEEPADPPVAATSRGALRVTTQPSGAAVTIAGKKRGVTPLEIDDLAPGSHAVTLESGTSVLHRKVVVEAGKTAALEVSIYPGWLALFSPIELQISSGGRVLRLDEESRVMLPPGEHELRLVNAALGYRDVRTVNIQPGKTTALSITLPQTTVRLSAAAGAEVWLDGTLVGTTPMAEMRVDIGTHELVVRHGELGTRRLTITATADPLEVDVFR